jgi:hypothetical protein
MRIKIRMKRKTLRQPQPDRGGTPFLLRFRFLRFSTINEADED